MANTKIPVELSSTPGIVDGSNATAITIDSSENSTFAGTVTVNGAGNTLVLNASSGVTYQKFSENGTGRFFLATLNGADGLAFVDADGSAERMRIDSSGKLLIGDSASHVDDLLQIETPASGGGHGIQIRRNDTNTDQFIGSLTFGNNSDTDIAGIFAKTDGASDSGALLLATQATGGSSTERMRIDSSGNVGIGTSSPSYKLHLSGTGLQRFEIDSTDNNVNGCGVYLKVLNSGSAVSQSTIANDNAGNLKFFNGTSSESEAMRIDSSNNLLVGQTSLNYNVVGSSISSAGLIRACVDGGLVLALNRKTSHGQLINFYKDGSTVGSISTNTYSLPSDKNFKRNIKDLNIGLNLVTKLKPSQYNYKIDSEDCPKMYGLIAQDLEESLTEVGVEKNSTWLLQHEPNDDEKESDYSVDYLKLTPVLIKAIQEQQELIETQQTTINDLKSRVETLEG
jgi:hypothetical protein